MKSKVNGWNYFGDINLTCGGYFWKEPDNSGTADYVECIDIVPVSDLGGPDNAFIIETGSVYLPYKDAAKLKSALDTIGLTPEEATRGQIVEAFKATWGMDDRSQLIVMIGKPTRYDPEMPGDMGVDIQIRGNWKLHNYVRAEYLN